MIIRHEARPFALSLAYETPSLPYYLEFPIFQIPLARGRQDCLKYLTSSIARSATAVIVSSDILDSASDNLSLIARIAFLLKTCLGVESP